MHCEHLIPKCSCMCIIIVHACKYLHGHSHTMVAKFLMKKSFSRKAVAWELNRLDHWPLTWVQHSALCIVQWSICKTHAKLWGGKTSAWSNKVNIGHIYAFALNKCHESGATFKYSISELKSLNCVFSEFLESVCGVCVSNIELYFRALSANR